MESSSSAMILMIYSNTQIGVERLSVEARIRGFTFVVDVSGREGEEGWNSDVFIRPGMSTQAALALLLSLLRDAHVPQDTYIVDDAQQEHYVFQPR